MIYRGNAIPNEFYPKENYLVRALLWRSRKDQNSFVLIVGYPRTSKSSFAIKTCERMAKLKGQDFDIEKQLTFDDLKKFFIWSQDAEDSMFILDETGTTLSPDSFWSLQQRIMRRFVQAQGFRKNILFWVLPSIIFIQKNFRFLCHYGINTIRQGLVSVSKIKVDQLLGKGWTEWTGITIKFSLPSEDIWNRYNNMKRQWNDETLSQDINYMELMSKPDEKALRKEEYYRLRNENLKVSIKLRKSKLLSEKRMSIDMTKYQ